MPKKNPRRTEAPLSKSGDKQNGETYCSRQRLNVRLKRRAKDGEGFTREVRTKDGVAISGEIVFRNLMTENRPHF